MQFRARRGGDITSPICYVSAKMRGTADGNFPLIDSVAEYMRGQGWYVYDPATNDRAAGLVGEDAATFGTEPGKPGFKDLMRLDLMQVADSDAIVMCPGWETSEGAGIEKYVAEVCGVEVLYAYFTKKPWSNGYHWFVCDTYLGDDIGHWSPDAVRSA